ncbi:MAG: NHL repeat-containing protein [Anaerocolumna sp.]
MLYLRLLRLGFAFSFILMELCGCSQKNNTSPEIPESTYAPNPSPKHELKLIQKFTGFSSPTAIAFDSEDNMYVSNWSNGTVSKIDSAGNVTIFVNDLGSPAGLAFDSEDNLYIADYSDDVIYRCPPKGTKEIYAQDLHTPTGISFNDNGELLVANRGSDEIIKIDKAGNIVSISNEMNTPVGVIEADDTLYTTNYGGNIITITSDRKTNIFSTEFGRPGVGIDVASNGQIYAADNGDGCVRILNSDGSTKIIVEDIEGCVGVKVHSNILYISSWNEGAVYGYTLPTIN